MSDRSKIEWTDATWNPVTGCTKVSAGCAHCYTERDFHRPYPERQFTDVQLHPDRLEQPLRWRKPRRIFVVSMGDLFHEAVPDRFIYRVFAVMALAPRHTFQVVTKRAKRMHRWISDFDGDLVNAEAGVLMHWDDMPEADWPLRNLWLGVSVENQATAGERIPLLLQTPAAGRWVSYEPALAPVDLRDYFDDPGDPGVGLDPKQGLDWVVCGGESGPKARPMHPEWARSVRDQCQAAGVPFFFKQWGAWSPLDSVENARLLVAGNPFSYSTITDSHRAWVHMTGGGGSAERPFRDSWAVRRVGKRAAGRLLDGREWNEFPNARSVDEKRPSVAD